MLQVLAAGSVLHGIPVSGAAPPTLAYVLEPLLLGMVYAVPYCPDKVFS